tara:strand:+ start:428 stop:670 length:243 start_codon:yes stop_codon:yes gene_type:complete
MEQKYYIINDTETEGVRIREYRKEELTSLLEGYRFMGKYFMDDVPNEQDILTGCKILVIKGKITPLRELRKTLLNEKDEE